jgi:imidazolonepropionase
MRRVCLWIIAFLWIAGRHRRFRIWFFSRTWHDLKTNYKATIPHRNPKKNENGEFMTTVLKNAAQLGGVFDNDERRRYGPAMRSPGIIADGALIMHGGRIEWIGPTASLPPLPQDAEIIDVSGQLVLPGFVDSHTHLLFAGSRENEFEQRLQGVTYQEITARGGGIMSTVRSVRQKSREELKQLARPRLKRLLAFGVTTVEVKSGYGLTPEDERKCLEAIAELNQEQPVELVPTFLGAHAVPEEYRDRRDEYIRLLIDEMLPDVAQNELAVFCDVFCETGVFSLAESERILNRARDLGLQVKLHADELTPLGGAELAAKVGAASADHLLCITDAGIDALAASETVATLLPGTAFFLGLPYAPARTLIDRGVPVALASDCNPGTCPTENLTLVGSMACTQMGMLPGEVITALTLNGAAALRCSDRVGALAAGRQADLIVCDVPNAAHLFYHFGVNHVRRVYKRGRAVHAV